MRMNLGKRGAPSVARWLVGAIAFFGFAGLAASKIYDLGRGSSIGGYGEGYYDGNSSQNQNVGVSWDFDSPLGLTRLTES